MTINARRLPLAPLVYILHQLHLLGQQITPVDLAAHVHGFKGQKGRNFTLASSWRVNRLDSLTFLKIEGLIWKTWSDAVKPVGQNLARRKGKGKEKDGLMLNITTSSFCSKPKILHHPKKDNQPKTTSVTNVVKLGMEKGSVPMYLTELMRKKKKLPQGVALQVYGECRKLIPGGCKSVPWAYEVLFQFRMFVDDGFDNRFEMARQTLLLQVERAKDLLGLIHTDCLCRNLNSMSRQGASYFVTFTDDFSRYGYVYLLKHKHEVFETFKVFQKEVENQLGKTIKSLRSDRGGEYMSQEFLDHLKEHGIIAHRTPPYTPQNNGVSERRNRTLLDMVRSMMSQTTLPKSFWDYALETAARILNMVPSKKSKLLDLEIAFGELCWEIRVLGVEKDLEREAAYILGIKIYRDRIHLCMPVRLLYCPDVAFAQKLDKLISTESGSEFLATLIADIDGARQPKVAVLNMCSFLNGVACTGFANYIFWAWTLSPQLKNPNNSLSSRRTIKMGDVRIEKIDTDDNLADPFTKALAFPKHSELTRNIGLLPASSFM
ncbi:retrotransposon protein, putative, ty1-copia subclass [Tanacetum coccineum]